MTESSEFTHEFLHDLIQGEFRTMLTSERADLQYDTDGIVVLSAGTITVAEGKAVEPGDPQNRQRIEYGIEIVNRIVAHKAKKALEAITTDDIEQYAPPLVLSGLAEQFEGMTKIAEEHHFPESKVILLDCTIDGVGNTKTQFTIMNEHPMFREAKHLSFVSSDYHIPRMARTAEKNLKPEIGFDVIQVPHDRSSYNVFRAVKREVRRIKIYAGRGDIAVSAPYQKTGKREV